MTKQFSAGRLIRSLPLSIPLAFVLILGSGGTALAQDTATKADVWQFEITPYLWATRMNGDVQTDRVPKTDVSMRFPDILENLDFGFMTAFEARKGRWGILFDGMTMKVSDAATSSSPDASLSVDANVRIQQTMLATAIAYRIVDAPTALDLIGGLRYNRIHVDTDIDARLFGLTGTVSQSDKKDWVDPYVGIRVIQALNAKWNAIGYLDIGGFGVGSDATWQGQVGLSYAYSGSTQLSLGYRYMKVDYQDDGFRYSMANDGLYTGLGIRF